MAFAVKGTLPNSKDVIYNVEQAVGSNGANAAGDVKLVQYMLRHIYGNAAAGLAVDGYIGPMTMSFIKRFQQDAQKGVNNVLVDQRIDRAFGQTSSVSKTVYTILLMNLALKKKNPNAFASLPQNVPLSANPKDNPYNPVKKQVKLVVVYDSAPPKRVEIHYTDGSVEVAQVSGQVVVDGQVIG
jgi:peptidoglycan hydrolase-like protein with peptidoglycan-binding domain